MTRYLKGGFMKKTTCLNYMLTNQFAIPKYQNNMEANLFSHNFATPKGSSPNFASNIKRISMI